MNALALFNVGYDYKGVKSILENYCVICLAVVPETEGAQTDDGLECDRCCEQNYK
jgi:hypothetical protein